MRILYNLKDPKSFYYELLKSDKSLNNWTGLMKEYIKKILLSIFKQMDSILLYWVLMHCFYILLLYINFIYIQQGVIMKEKRSVTVIEKIIQEIFRIIERKRSSGFRRMFTVAFLLFLAPAWNPNPVGQSLTFTYAYLSKSTQYILYIFRWSVCNATKNPDIFLYMQVFNLSSVISLIFMTSL